MKEATLWTGYRGGNEVDRAENNEDVVEESVMEAMLQAGNRGGNKDVAGVSVIRQCCRRVMETKRCSGSVREVGNAASG